MNAPSRILRVETLRSGDPALAEVAQYVRAHPDALPFHLPAWSEAVETALGHRAHFLVARGADGALAAYVPFSEVRSRLFGSALVSAGFAVGGGILGEASAAAMLADHASRLATEARCPAVELRGGMLPADWHRQEGVYSSFVRDLPAGEEAILKAVPRKQRAEVRRAIGFGLETRVGRSPGEVGAHYRVYAESVRNLGTPVFPRRLFEAVLERFGEDADILTIARDGAPLASVLSLYWNKTVYPYWGGGTGAARRWRANELLYFELMKHASARGCTRFDFGRSKLGTGAWSFKKNWGFEPQPLVYAVHTKDGAAPRQLDPRDPKYRLQVAAWQRMPLWLANRLGPLLARGLG